MVTKENNFKEYNKETAELIKRLIERYAPAGSEDIFGEILSTVIRLGAENAEKGDLKLINKSLKELRHAFKIFADYRNVRKVALFGSSRVDSGSIEYQMAKEFSEEISRLGFMLITGAGAGIMQAGNEGAGPDNSFGVNIRLPFGQKENPFIQGNRKCMTFKYFFTRKLIFIKESDATALFPGGFGTLDETFESLTLFQTGKCRPRPIVLIEPEGSSFWYKWVSLLNEKLLKNDFISRYDIKLFSYHNSVKSAVEEIRDFYRIYDSIRYIGDETRLYLKKPISESLIADIIAEFKDIFIDNTMKMVSEPSGNSQKNSGAGRPCLIFKFNRKDFGRLCEMIRYINKNG